MMKKILAASILSIVSFSAISAPVCKFDVTAWVTDGSNGAPMTASCNESVKAIWLQTNCETININSGWIQQPLLKGQRVSYIVPKHLFNKDRKCIVKMAVRDSQNKVHWTSKNNQGSVWVRK